MQWLNIRTHVIRLVTLRMLWTIQNISNVWLYYCYLIDQWHKSFKRGNYKCPWVRGLLLYFILLSSSFRWIFCFIISHFRLLHSLFGPESSPDRRHVVNFFKLIYISVKVFFSILCFFDSGRLFVFWISYQKVI